MNTDGKFWFSAVELARLGETRVIDFPRNERNTREKAKRLGWDSREVQCKGGRRGYMTEFRPPTDVLSAIHDFLNENPDFFGKDNKTTPQSIAEITAPALQSPPLTSGLADFVFVPKYDVSASAGHGSVVHSEQIVDHLAFKKVWIKSTLGCSEKDLALITVKGDSMEPTLSSEDLILVNLQRNQITDNAVYVLQYDGSLLVKRIQRLMNGSVIIKSDNPEYRTEELSADQVGLLRVLGVVVWYGRRM